MNGQLVEEEPRVPLGRAPAKYLQDSAEGGHGEEGTQGDAVGDGLSIASEEEGGGSRVPSGTSSACRLGPK